MLRRRVVHAQASQACGIQTARQTLTPQPALAALPCAMLNKTRRLVISID